MAEPRKLNATKQGHRTKEELEYQELKENGLSQFNKIDVKSVPSDLTKEGKRVETYHSFTRTITYRRT